MRRWLHGRFDTATTAARRRAAARLTRAGDDIPGRRHSQAFDAGRRVQLVDLTVSAAVPPALTRIANGEAAHFPPERIRKASTPAVYWDGEAWTPAWIVASCYYYGEWFVRLRTRRDVWRDREAWYAYRAGALLAVRPDPRDLRDWLPRRPTS